MLLTVKERQKYLKALKLYDGEIDGKESAKLKDSYKKLQNKYFVREKDRDGLYGSDTDILLRNAYKVKTYAKNFELRDFRCPCGGKYCDGYPVILSTQLLKNIQLIRDKFGPTDITSGIRCQRYNDSIPGSVKNSYHVKGKASDFANANTSTLSKRRVVMGYWKKLPRAGYTYCNENGNFPNMGNAIHVQVN